MSVISVYQGEGRMAVIGNIIDNKYEILKLVGRGGMSEVYLAMDTNLNKQWAVKEIKKTGSTESQIAVESAIVEAGLIKELDHPSIPRIVDILDYDEVVYIIMDYIEGEPLSHILKREEKLPEELVLSIAESICNILIYLHSNEQPIIYRDIKPDNIMISPSGAVKLIDFGIARRYKAESENDTVCLGTKGYAAPEQFLDGKQSDMRTDIYGLGVTMYHMVTGKKPTEEPYELYPIRYWDNSLSAGLESIIIKCTKNNPKERYQSADELLYALWHYEEADEAYRKKQAAKLMITGAVMLFSAVCFVAGIFTRVKYVQIREMDYETLLIQASEAKTDEDRYEIYDRAIALLPGEAAAYHGVIESIKSDGEFSVEEEAFLREKIDKNMNKIVKAKNAADIFYEMGHIYWFYYSYGEMNENDNSITAMKAALPWFQNALAYAPKDWDKEAMCNVYVSIASFNTSINLMVEEATDAGRYSEYFDELLQLNELLDIDDSELLNLEICELTLHAMELYSRKYANDGVEGDAVLALYETVVNKSEAITATTDKTAAIKKIIDDNKDIALACIKAAYNIKD